MPDNTAMTVDADLATLRHALTPGNYSNGPGCQAALARVEAELSRLREQVKFCPYCAGGFVPNSPSYQGPCAGCQRAEAAEARCARLQQALEQISETANWYARNDARLQHEVDHCLCVEIPSIADEALAGLGSEQSPLTESGIAGLLDTPADSQPEDSQEDEWFIPEGDRQCGVVHKDARARCMKRRGHEGDHATTQGSWIDGPWCEYPADSQEDDAAIEMTVRYRDAWDDGKRLTIEELEASIDADSQPEEPT